ncbi:MAG: leucine-rich repeat domain-containing protein [Ruminococcus sp.]|nr:leucine-rich repeat domain-containing protein [Ruminococcus sp.]
MEKFEINENGCLTAYHNDNKNVTEITVPDGVKYISVFVFKEYGKFNTVVLPDSLEGIDQWAFWNSFANEYTITYRGIIIFSVLYQRLPLDEVIKMIRNKDYSCVLDHDVKYPVVLQIYFNDGDDVTTAYIKKNFRKFFMFLIEKITFQNIFRREYYDLGDATEVMQKLISSGKFITRRNIETYVKIADEKECFEVFDMLNEYREEYLK